MKQRQEAAQDVSVSGNAAVEILRSGIQNGRYALAYVDAVEVIERHRFVDVAHEAAQWAELLLRLELQPGSRVIVLAGRDRHWRSALLGVLKAGGVAAPCSAALPLADLRVLAQEGRAVAAVSASPRPELVEQLGIPVLSPMDLDARQRRYGVATGSHEPSPDDFALILSERHGLSGEAHTHASLLDRAASSARALGIRRGGVYWRTAPEGSAESVWLTLAAWHAGVELVALETDLAHSSTLELLHRLPGGAVWFSDDEYAAFAVADVASWVDLTHIRHALTSGQPGPGAIAFQNAFGVEAVAAEVAGEPADADAAPARTADVVPITLAPAGRSSESREATEERRRLARAAARAEEERRAEETRREEERIRAEREEAEQRALAAEAARAEEEARRREEQGAKERQQEEQRRREEEAEQRALAAKAARAEDERRAAEEKRLEKERLRAEKEARRREQQQAKEREKEEQRRRKEESDQRALAAKAARAEDARRAEEGKRREEERLRSEKEARQREQQQAKEREKEEQRRRKEEAEQREIAAKAARAEEARRAAEEKRLEKERLRAEKEARRREQQQAKERNKEELRRRNEEAKQRRLAEEAARAEKERRAEEEKRREEERRRAVEAARRREEQQARERQKEDERRRRKEAKERELSERAARADERRRIEEAKRLAEEEQQRPRDEATGRERAEREADQALRRGENADRAAAIAAAVQEPGPAEDAKRRAARRPREAEDARAEGLPPEVLSRLGEYGVTTAVRDRDPATTQRGPEALMPDERREAL